MDIDNFRKLTQKFQKNSSNNRNDIININSLNNVYGSNPKNNKFNKLSKKLVETCNNILVTNETNCQCYDNNNYPLRNHQDCSKNKNNIKKCKNYNKCKTTFSKFMSGYEPYYNPDEWSNPLVEGTHNCYMYFLNDQQLRLKNKCLDICKNKGHNNKTCKSKKINSCSNLKPQPGNHAYRQGIIPKRKRKYTCKEMVYKVLKDNYDKQNKRYNIKPVKFNQKCPSNTYKGAMVVDTNNTYHFYRQDDNVRYSHKQGTLRVENKDASGNPIYAPHLADRDYNKKKKKDGITYDKFCSYFCIPNNNYRDTNAH